MKNLNVFIGYDSEQDIAFSVCKQSILNYTNESVIINKINSDTINGYNRAFDPLASTPFTYARFYIPFIANYEGCSVFCDGDFLFLNDIKILFDMFDPNFAVQVVKHNYTPSSTIKMNNKIQTSYPKKNWSSLIIWNNEHPKNKQLNLSLLNSSTGSFLHQFKWLEETDIGEIPCSWNWLVGWYQKSEKLFPNALHFTEGGPWLKPIENEYDNIWIEHKNLFAL
jgi:lipopolysaccharide biosynthesis glycosyltransferase